MGKRKYIESKEKWWELFCGYKKWVEENPILIQDYVGKEGEEVYRKRPRPLTMEGFECYVMNHTDITYPDLTVYFEGKNESYAEYFPISARIKKEIRANQIEGGMAQIFSQSLTARINDITEKTDITTNGNEIKTVDVGSILNKFMGEKE